MIRIEERYNFFPSIRVRGVTLEDENGDYTILINPDLSDEMKEKTIKHEMYHISHNHFEDTYTGTDAEKDVRANA